MYYLPTQKMIFKGSHAKHMHGFHTCYLPYSSYVLYIRDSVDSLCREVVGGGSGLLLVEIQGPVDVVEI